MNKCFAIIDGIEHEVYLENHGVNDKMEVLSYPPPPPCCQALTGTVSYMTGQASGLLKTEIYFTG